MTGIMLRLNENADADGDAVCVAPPGMELCKRVEIVLLPCRAVNGDQSVSIFFRSNRKWMS